MLTAWIGDSLDRFSLKQTQKLFREVFSEEGSGSLASAHMIGRSHGCFQSRLRFVIRPRASLKGAKAKFIGLASLSVDDSIVVSQLRRHSAQST